MPDFLDFLLHVNEHLDRLAGEYGTWTYVILFAIVFCETGLVVTPFLPGDSLLFAVGAFSARPNQPIDIWWVTGLLLVAAILGDTVNYHIGKYLGPRVLSGKYSRWLNPKHLERTQQFFERYGGKTIIIARFVPIVRTFAPFVAGVGTMNYPRFLAYNVIGAVLWVVGCTQAGYWLGNIPIVRDHFELVVLLIVALSLTPAAWEFAMHRLRRRRERQAEALAARAAAQQTEANSVP
jgi:membrane-associated protein